MEKSELFQIITSLPLHSDLTFKIFNLYREAVLDEVRQTLIPADEQIKKFLSHTLTVSQIIRYYLMEAEKPSQIIYEFQSEARCLVICELYKFIYFILLNHSYYLNNDKFSNLILVKAEELIEQAEESYHGGRLTQSRYSEMIDILLKVKRVMNPVDPWFPF